MERVVWHGPAPPEAVESALYRADLRVEPAGHAHGSGPHVVFTASDRLPTRPDRDAPWIWLSRAAVDDARMVEAVIGGAYAVISLRAPGAGDALAARVHELLTPAPSAPTPLELVAGSETARQVITQAAKVAPTSMPVLLTGETGTGKEMLARLIHGWSPRAHKPLVPINCAAIPNELMEAELFGYARGAFTGALQRYDGQLMAAEGGTVFLDEVDDTPLETQTKLLRVLEDRVVSRLGESTWHKVDFRLLAATNRNLRALIDAGLFGADLYERLAIVTIHLPPLRERLDDLPALARHFMQRFAQEQGRPLITDLSPEAERALSAYRWPGNVRELRNVVYEMLVYKRAGTEVLLSDLPKRILAGRPPDQEPSIDRSAITRKIDRGTMSLKEEVAALERAAIEEALKRTGGNAAHAARLLGEVGRGVARDPGGTLRAMMRRLNPRAEEPPRAGRRPPRRRTR
jgi:DNA-binding NtrC family response regulator